jgi:hypothetical protein
MRMLTIDRQVWLRGEGEDSSCLYRPRDGKMCCLGIYLTSLGVPKDSLAHVVSPGKLNTELPRGAGWLLRNGLHTDIAANLMIANDTGTTGPLLDPDHCVEGDGDRVTPRQRETCIRALFRQAKIRVRFTN